MLVPRPMWVILLAVMLALSLQVTAQKIDPHLDGDPASALYSRSAFVHGYIHGYEQGFHVGNIDLHMGHAPQRLKLLKSYRDPRGYRSEFGDRDLFRHGYQQGFHIGYDDALRGDSFRAIAEIRRAAEGLEANAPAKSGFDQAVSAGYQAGWTEGLQRPNTSPSFPAAGEECLKTQHNPSFCDAYLRGFGVGYADGSVVEDARRTETARVNAR